MSAPLPQLLNLERRLAEGSADPKWPEWREAPHTQREKGEEIPMP